ncbi:hypothetical protein EIN_370390 [Entamoeba invadens IP1]|uniref:Uncharacterized protein n=1 Tax=Entamoeba invadens IP1 TaxID=370355 RepID=A0A0A1UGI6_ENTIV|nr:hypothetical protein EIN_370390 [Entamoeba invadens IP1]ELP92687.1 hypothetical protein EIN_370390 [Entamoeba invadens IP1]|eukprot:XP_004259458.1 hypothetical protein EIN_370390 [Entamoeba invadens IP1]
MKSSLNKTPRFIEVRNFQVYEGMVLLSLINTRFNITLRIPNKRANVYEQILMVDSVWNKSMRIDVKSYIKQRCDERMKIEVKSGLSPKTALRRRHNNTIIETLVFLIDLVLEMGYFVETTECGGKKGTLKEEYIRTIFKNNSVVFNEKSLCFYGKRIGDYVTSREVVYGSIMIHENDKTIQNIIVLTKL